MKNNKTEPQSPIPARRKLLFALSICLIMFFGAVSTDALAGFEASFLYSLSNFSGFIPYNWANISVDYEKNEIYVVDIRERDITVFNDMGMEIYRFGDDGTLGTVIDVAVGKTGDIFVLSSRRQKSTIILCNFRGEPLSELELKNFPPDFTRFSPHRIAYRQERLYLLDTNFLRLAVTDTNGVFQKGYDIGSLVGVEDDEDRIKSQISGFSVDRKGNMLFTIPVFFAAYNLSPDGNLTGFGTPGSAPGKFNIVGGIVRDDEGYYYVADKLKSAVLIFDKDLTFQGEFGYRGSRSRNLISPKYLALDSEGRLYVSQLRSKGISVFKINYNP